MSSLMQYLLAQTDVQVEEKQLKHLIDGIERKNCLALFKFHLIEKHGRTSFMYLLLEYKTLAQFYLEKLQRLLL